MKKGPEKFFIFQKSHTEFIIEGIKVCPVFEVEHFF